MLIEPSQATDTVDNCLNQTREKLVELSKDFDIKDFPVDAPEKKKQYIKSTMEFNPFKIFVKKEFGGYGGSVKDGLSLLSLASYDSLQLTLVYGINWALFIQPLQKYGSDQARKEILKKVCDDKMIGGLMITEPDYGSDALNMKTQNINKGDHYHITGQKHWGGLTGIADYWVLTTRELKDNGNLGRDIDFFVSDNNATNQKIDVSKYYHTGGLEIITYGLNQLNIKVPAHQKFIPETTGIKTMLDTLHRSRINFSGMGMGYIHRLMDEALKHCTNRIVSGKALVEYDKVKERLAGIQSAFTINSSMCHYASQTTQLEKDLSMMGVEANCIKTLLTDIMQESAQSLVQLKGGNGYIKDDIAGRAIMDSRPFQIFEGSNDILYMQIGEAIVKKMMKAKNDNFRSYVAEQCPAIAHEPCLTLLDQVTVPGKRDQQNLHTLGEIFACLFSLNNLAKLALTGFNNDLIIQANLSLAKRIKGFVTKLACPLLPEILVDYKGQSNWADFS